MLKVGITGNIGSGKTTVSKIFELLGVPVFYADESAKRLMTTDRQLVAAIKQLFGNDAYLADGKLDRKYIAGKVFGNEAELQKLNALVHPAVFKDFDRWAQTHTANAYVLKEAAILFESGSFKMCDYSVVVTAPLETRLTRIMMRDKITREDALSREARQIPQEEKVKLANFVIVNDDSRLVIPQVIELHQHLLKLCAGK